MKETVTVGMVDSEIQTEAVDNVIYVKKDFRTNNGKTEELMKFALEKVVREGAKVLYFKDVNLSGCHRKDILMLKQSILPIKGKLNVVTVEMENPVYKADGILGGFIKARMDEEGYDYAVLDFDRHTTAMTCKNLQVRKVGFKVVNSDWHRPIPDNFLIGGILSISE